LTRFPGVASAACEQNNYFHLFFNLIISFLIHSFFFSSLHSPCSLSLSPCNLQKSQGHALSFCPELLLFEQVMKLEVYGPCGQEPILIITTPVGACRMTFLDSPLFVGKLPFVIFPPEHRGHGDPILTTSMGILISEQSRSHVSQ